MSDRITFAQFDAVLADLGFEKQVIPGSHVNYRHADWDKPLMIQIHKPRDIVPGYVLLGTRVQLEQFGIVDAADFEQMLQAAAA